MKHARWSALALLLALPAGVAAAQERALSGGASYGGPLGAAATGELLCGLRADVRDEDERLRALAGLLVQLHAGSGGGKLSLGLGARARVDSEGFRGDVGAGIKLSLARTWGSPVGTASGLTYLGPELDLTAMHVGLSLGPLFRVGGAGGPAVLFSWGIGVRF